MPDIVLDVGEEWVVENDVNGATVKVTLYSDSTDSITDTDNLSAISTEPAGGSFARQSTTVTSKQISGDFGFDNDSKLTFDMSDSSQTIDHALYVVNFQSNSVAGDESATDNLVAVASLTQSRDTSQFDTLELPAGDLEATLD